MAAVGTYAVRSFPNQNKPILTRLEELLRKDSQSNINKPEFSQPISTAIQVALVDLLRSFDIYPAVVVGHSSGEIAAAYVGHLELLASANDSQLLPWSYLSKSRVENSLL